MRLIVSSFTVFFRSGPGRACLARALLFAFTAKLLLLLAGCFEKEEIGHLSTFTGQTMGTSYTINVVSSSASFPITTLQSDVETRLAVINKQMSTYDPESSLSIFNQNQSTDWFDIPSDTIELIRVATRVSRSTDGAYDVTLGSVIDLWGFGKEAASDGDKPSMDLILDKMNEVGHQLLQISKDGTQIRKLIPELTVDLSSIAKGYAVDVLGELLEKNDISRYVVEIGGEIRTRGLGVDNQPWQIGIESPDPTTQAAGFMGIAVESAHIATSGNYRNYREVDGKRFSHIIDGRSGYPVEHNLASVTVLHGSTTQADAWATAFMVMGVEEAIKVAAEKGLAAAFTIKEDQGFVNRTTKAFDAYKVK